MITKLNQIAEISSGYSFRKKVEHDKDGDLTVVQMKDLKSNYTEINKDLSRINSKEISKIEKYLLNKGDVLFVSKGANNYASVVDQDIKAVAASVFFVLRPKQEIVLPEYLAWYINEKEAQKFIEEKRAGSYNPSVSKSTVLDMPVKLPNLSRQKLIASLYFLKKRESSLTQQLLEKRHAVISHKLFQILN